MNKLSKVFLVWLTLGLLSIAHAACDPAIDHYVGQFMVMMEERVVLSAEQQAALRDALCDGIGIREDVIASYQGQSGMKAKRALKSELDGVNETLRDNAQTILDQNQYRAFLEVQEQTREEVKGRVNQMMGG